MWNDSGEYLQHRIRFAELTYDMRKGNLGSTDMPHTTYILMESRDAESNYKSLYVFTSPTFTLVSHLKLSSNTTQNLRTKADDSSAIRSMLEGS